MLALEHIVSMNAVSVLKSSFLSGICIGIAGFGYLARPDIVGSVLFTFALIAVVSYKLKLYTGTAGFIARNEVGHLLLVLVGNILGCAAMASLTRLSAMPLQETAQTLLAEKRLVLGALNGGLLAVGCGFIMTTAVTFARKGNVLPMLFGVPLFITCGFPHCVADAFFYLCAPLEYWAANMGDILTFYGAIVLGNFAGCNAYRWIAGGNPE